MCLAELNLLQVMKGSAKLSKIIISPVPSENADCQRHRRW